MSHQTALAAISRMNMQPVLAAPFSVNSIAAALTQLARADVAGEQKSALEARTELLAAYGFSQSAPASKPFAFVEGIAIIPVHGTLLNRFGQSWGYVTGYNFIRSQMNAADADPDVKGIIFDINSYGGEAAGCFELAAEIKTLEKPTLGVVDSNAYSAGYAILSGVDTAVVTPSGGVGSVGVISMHVSLEKMLSDAGVTITLIYSGDHKADGNPFSDLPDEVKVNMQANVDSRRQEFSALVADNRGMDVKVIMDTEAQTYRANDALALGLIDAVATPAEAVAAFLNELSGSTTNQERSMSTNNANAQPGASGAESAGNPVSEQQLADARKAERERMSAIISCDEAKDKASLANHLALNTQLSVDEAKGILAASQPEAKSQPAPAATQNAFAAAMNADASKGKNPDVGADAEGQDASAPGAQTQVQKMLADHHAATGTKLQ